MRKSCVGDATQPIFHLFALGVGIGGNANFSGRVGGNTNFSIFRYQHVGIPNAKLSCWGYQREAPTRELLVAVEYRLKSATCWDLMQ